MLQDWLYSSILYRAFFCGTILLSKGTNSPSSCLKVVWSRSKCSLIALIHPSPCRIGKWIGKLHSRDFLVQINSNTFINQDKKCVFFFLSIQYRASYRSVLDRSGSKSLRCDCQRQFLFFYGFFNSSLYNSCSLYFGLGIDCLFC